MASDMPVQSTMKDTRVKDGVAPRVRLLPVASQVAERQPVGASGHSAAVRRDSALPAGAVSLPVQFLGSVRFMLSCMRMGVPPASAVVGTGKDGYEGMASSGNEPLRVGANDGLSAMSG